MAPISLTAGPTEVVRESEEIRNYEAVLQMCLVWTNNCLTLNCFLATKAAHDLTLRLNRSTNFPSMVKSLWLQTLRQERKLKFFIQLQYN